MTTKVTLKARGREAAVLLVKVQYFDSILETLEGLRRIAFPNDGDEPSEHDIKCWKDMSLYALRDVRIAMDKITEFEAPKGESK